MVASGIPDEILLEDAEDLAEWRARPPFLVTDKGRVVPQGPIPPEWEWVDSDQVPPDPFASLRAFIGSRLGDGGGGPVDPDHKPFTLDPIGETGDG